MTRAEEAALTAYPTHKGASPQWIKAHLSSFDEFIKGYEQAEKDTIERACETLFAMLPIMVSYYDEDIHEHADRGEFIKQFRMKMEEQK